MTCSIPAPPGARAPNQLALHPHIQLLVILLRQRAGRVVVSQGIPAALPVRICWRIRQKHARMRAYPFSCLPACLLTCVCVCMSKLHVCACSSSAVHTYAFTCANHICPCSRSTRTQAHVHFACSQAFKALLGVPPCMQCEAWLSATSSACTGDASG